MTTFGVDQVPGAVAIAIDEFLQSGSGQVFIEALKARTPELDGCVTIEQTAMRANEAKGWSNCIREMLSIAKERPELANPLSTPPINMSPADDSNPTMKPKGEVH
jgi:hypothetical protein